MVVVVLAGCGRFHFANQPDADVADACALGATCTPAAVCWTGACSSVGCTIDQPLDQVACPGGTCATGVCTGNASPPFMPNGNNNYFGTSVDSDGQRIVVGAVLANAAYVLERTGTTWAVTATLTSAYGPPQSDFGAGVAIDGDLIVVGSRYSKGPGQPPASGTGGAIAIYQRDTGNQWLEIADVLGPDGGEFGGAVDISNGRIVVGAEYGQTLSNGWGDAYIVEGAGPSWSVVARFDDVAADRLGHFVQISGDRAVIGSLWDPGPSSSETGAVRVWERQPNSTWTLVQKIQPDDPRPDAFGQGFHLAGDRLAIGVPWFSNSAGGTGAVYIYTRDTATGMWQSPGPILPPVEQKDGSFGRGIWLDSSRVFATSIDWASMPSGAVTTSIYRIQPDGTWLEVGRRIDPGGGDNGFSYGGIECDLQMAGVGDEVVVGFPIRGYTGGQAPGAIVFEDVTGL
jgi:hypothetical protein